MQLTHIAALGALALTACASDRAATPSFGTDACGHFADGPIETATASATAAEAPAVSAQHTRYDVGLETMGADRGGFLKVTITASGEYTFLFDHAVALTIADGAGTPIAPAATAGSDADCATVGRENTYALGVGSYTLGIASGGDDPLLLVWMHAPLND